MKRFLVDPIRTVLVWIVGVISTTITSATVTAIAAVRPDSPAIDRTLRAWSRSWLWVAGVDLEITGSEKIDPSRSYVIVSNHRSNLDIMVNFLAAPVPIRFLAKKELFRIPLVGTAMRAIGIIEVDREKGAAIHNQLNAEAGDALTHARSIMVYPEGTRTRDGSMQPFKKGAFAIAVANELPIVPITIEGSYQVWPPESLVRGGRIRAHVGDVIETTGMTRRDIITLTKDVRQLILDDYARLASN